MVTLPVVFGIGITACTGAPAKVSGSAGPRRLVAKVWTSRWRLKNQRSSAVAASSRNGGPSSAAEVPGAARLRWRVMAAVRVTRAARPPPTGRATGIIPTWLPSWPPVACWRADTGTETVTRPSSSPRLASKARSAPAAAARITSLTVPSQA